MTTGELPVIFSVDGVPVPQGSKRVGRAGGRKNGTPILIDDNDARLKSWRNMVAFKAKLEWVATPPALGPLAVEIGFRLPQPKRPKHHLPIVKPDIDKLARAMLDAITEAGIWHDDSQVVHLSVGKMYAEEPTVPGALVRIKEAT